MDKIYYTISEVCKLLKIKPHTIRYWETEFIALKNKTKKGYARRYTNKDIELLQLIKSLIHDRKFTLEGAKAEIKRLKKEATNEAEAQPEDEVEVLQAQETEEAQEDEATEPDETAQNEEKGITWGELQKKFQSMSETKQMIEQAQQAQPQDSDYDDVMVAKPLSIDEETFIDLQPIIVDLGDTTPISMPTMRIERATDLRNELVQIKRILQNSGG